MWGGSTPAGGIIVASAGQGSPPATPGPWDLLDSAGQDPLAYHSRALGPPSS
jgi:hypothetical protein